MDIDYPFNGFNYNPVPTDVPGGQAALTEVPVRIASAAAPPPTINLAPGCSSSPLATVDAEIMPVDPAKLSSNGASAEMPPSKHCHQVISQGPGDRIAYVAPAGTTTLLPTPSGGLYTMSAVSTCAPSLAASTSPGLPSGEDNGGNPSTPALSISAELAGAMEGNWGLSWLDNQW
ncbi:hypothetical protein BV22DRAFT_1135239 [Leucogyrophana mollusca]|uniref:Uncharacterized protein n=1 Tax=Leucogyrophana mollusca TaxID=85980 RepID=A0ACB8AXP2_9AGAM|nr:hypothetical protein BV22DRAFT_1135239 [Leucogyrophana mollusca]